ncbi:hypothetical protein MSAN_02462200 [Mycena sanguinolenta]|uniref:Uncharacterized protein n=1 Tax=Mycena sanguinolenta TaxID=230812 RepID=A0A8H6WX48_9AGAR|nr:hypothetical protein MSAN_02462200 [Mycena sanguinolenta]
MNQVPVAAAPKPRPRYRKSNAEKAASEQEHFNLVLAAAETTINILRQHNLPAAIFGSLACRLYGNSRCPKGNFFPQDADILVLTPASDITAEILKQLLVAAAPRFFYLKNARDPAATYRILWFRQPSHRRETKVDILVPGPMSLPHIPLPRIRWVSGLPLAPFCFILLHKLKGWADHRDAPEGFKRARQSTDAADVRRLLDIGAEMRVLQAEPSWYKDLELFDAELQADSEVRVRQYCIEFPGRAERWRSLGFDVPEPDTAVVGSPPVVPDPAIAA